MKGKMKFCINEDCNNKGQLLPQEAFHKGYNVCKVCHSKRVQDNQERGILQILEKLMEQGIINSNEVTSARTLYLSCKSRIEACKYKKGIYRNVSCDWEHPVTMMTDIIQKHPSMWQEWKVQDMLHMQTHQLNDRATIDRIDESKGYSLENIQCLSHFNNARKASSKPCIAMIIHNLRPVKVVEFDSLKEAMNELHIPYAVVNISIDSGAVQDIGNGYSILLQSEKGDIKESNEPRYLMALDYKREKYDIDTGETVEVLANHQYQMLVTSIGFNSRKYKDKKRPSEINSKG